ncbi:HpcH/HpaI aldolase/citrate lyase family protein [Falsirhodobacter sp. 20TX0035]|uniref:HpcH/HpaI aldolase/citrate lyase family protein n=1 Tax=Falsirhodobacter sp. 20TX0035 TaxID=3022019 RepID=UPI00233140B3|nr:CoA ester lyase [Falsirhodobacter sp. 20TX0035]MDB6452367.1 CoA ester lyase [Falsirhodobacter sp. 20TX0035]
MPIRPLRSALYVPATNARALEKARTLPCDAIIFDLEDAVSPDRKDEARAHLIAALRTTDYGHRLRLVRVNDATDIDALADVPLDALVLPKVRSADLPDSPHPLWVMMETAQAVLNAPAIAAHPRVEGLIMGTNDLERELHLRPRPDRLGLIHALGACVLAAKAAGKPILDGVQAAIHDRTALRHEAEQGLDLGFDGKTVIHPAQLEVVNEIFRPSAAEVDLARRQIAAHAAAEREGSAIAVVDGRIVEALHVAMARRTLALNDAIESL